jgi:hypothetical protein
MNRAGRAALAVLPILAAASPLVARARGRPGVPRIAVLAERSPTDPSSRAPSLPGFR